MTVASSAHLCGTILFLGYLLKSYKNCFLIEISVFRGDLSDIGLKRQIWLCREQRIVTVASSAHLFGTINFNDINNRKNYSPWPVYGQSKLANILFAFELSKRLPFTANLTSNALHPGVVDTELARYDLLSETKMFLTCGFLLAEISVRSSPGKLFVFVI